MAPHPAPPFLLPWSGLFANQPCVSGLEGCLVTMILDYYALQDDPFSPTAQPTWFFASRSHQMALQTLLESLKAGQAFMLLLGEPGIGKTFLVHAALAHRDLQCFTIVHLWYPPGSFHETLQMIGWELDLETATSDTAQLAHALHRALLTEHERGRQVVLVIDEAHTLPVEIVERLIGLSHVRAWTGAPLLQIVLVGLPTLGRHFSAPSLRPYKRRMVTRVTLAPLTYSESLAYIQHRLQQAGAGAGTIFTPGAVRHVARHARGNPRVMNTLCTNMLLTGFAAQQNPIAAPIAKDVITTYSTKSSRPRWWYGVTAAASILAVLGLIGLFPSISRIVTARGLRAFLPLTRSLQAGSGVETAQQPAQTVSSPVVSTLPALPTPTEAASPPEEPTARPTLSVQVAASPEAPAFQTLPPTSPATARIPPAAQPPDLPLETTIATPPPVVSEPPRALQIRREVEMPSKTAPSPRATPTPPVTTMITSPQHGAIVAQKIAVEGLITGLQPDQHVFVCVQSQAFGRRIYPQGKVRPDTTGKWAVESIYRSSGYKYETFLAVTTDTASAALLSAPLSRKYGLHALPPGTERLGTTIVVTRD
jgi:type II secretory pathway predicted ATPase ExeA